MDQAASVLGRAGHAVLIDTGTLAFEYVPLPARLASWSSTPGVSRRLESSANTAQRRRELEAGDPATRAARHVREPARGRGRGDPARSPGSRASTSSGPIFAEGHESLRVDFEVTIPELDLLVALAVEEGAVAARMTGGGFGGSIVALVDGDDATPSRSECLAGYRERVGDKGAAYVASPSNGAGEIR